MMKHLLDAKPILALRDVSVAGWVIQRVVQHLTEGSALSRRHLHERSPHEQDGRDSSNRGSAAHRVQPGSRAGAVN